VAEDKSFEKAVGYIFRLLKFRERSERELIAKLKRRKYSLDVINRTIQYLKKTGLVNDAHFARAWVSTRMALKPSGPFKLKYELKEKGINSQIIEEVLNSLKKKYDLRKVALNLAKKKISTSKIKDKNKLKRRLYDYLKRRGFSTEIILSCMQEIFRDFENIETDED
jgi:regulatory protein